MKKNNILAQRISSTLLLLIIARIGIFIPVPGIDHEAFASSTSTNNLVNFLNIFSGGGFSAIGIFALGIVPYINASLVVQLLSKTVPELERLQKEEGETGRQKIIQITRYLTLGWSIAQSLTVAIWIKPYVFSWNILFVIDMVISLTTGSIIVMWLSEIITEIGIGNGTSLLIFQNILAGIPDSMRASLSNYKTNAVIPFIFLSALFICMLSITILVQEGVRKVKIISARQLNRTSELPDQSYLPLKINQGGVMPIVFASASMGIPAYIQSGVHNHYIKQALSFFLSNGLMYSMVYGILILGFSYFYSSLALDTSDIAQNLKKMGASIPNVRPGEQTNKYLKKIINRLTFLGFIFLFTVALVPSIIAQVTQTSAFKGLGATSLLILVGVAIDTAKQIQTYAIAEYYKNIME